MVGAVPWIDKTWVPAGALRVALVPPETLFVFHPPSFFAPADARMLCTIPWNGGDVLLKYDRPNVLMRSRRDEPWKTHFSVVRGAKAAKKLMASGTAHSPYSVAVPYPVHSAVVDVLRTLGVKEVTVGVGSGEDEKPADFMDLTPLSALQLESMILSFDAYGTPVVRGLGGIRGLQALGIECFKNETLRLAIVKDCPGIRYLNIFASSLNCDADPRALSKLTYCRISAGKAVGIRHFVERVAASRLDLDVMHGLAELTRDTRLSPTVRDVLIEGAVDLKDVSFIKASVNVQHLRIVGCRFLGHTDEFFRSAPTESRRESER
jgi:hypothetical protein